MLSRAERSAFADWGWTVDRWFISVAGALIVFGFVLILAGSPAVAERLGLPPFHFVNKQLGYLVLAVFVMLGVSFMSPRIVRRSALLIYGGAMGLIFLALLYGVEVKGARRWILGVQPSEFLKPAFVILAAWAFSEGARRDDVPGNTFAMLLLPMTIAPLLMQPDFGQTMLVSLVWAGLFFTAGLHWLWVVGIGGLGAAGIFGAYHWLPHVRNRIDKFIDPASASTGVADTFQVDMAMESFRAGSWFGRGPGEGTFKRILPDSHTDFIFAVTGEEFGVVACLILLLLFAFIVLRGLSVASRNEDPFCRFATVGLVMLIGFQSAINMAVNLKLAPAKGMTLPFISYGGSSLLSVALTMGFLIAVTRRRPRSEVMDRVGK